MSALLQLAAYADALERNAIAASDQVHLLLGDGSTSSHDIGDIAPVFAARRAELERVLDEHRAEGKPTQWLDDRYLRCGRCDTCSVEVESHRDLLLVAGVRGNQREQLIVSGITTIDELAASTGPVEGIRRETLDKLRAQAAVQLRQELSGDAEFEVYEPSALGGLPIPDDGDIFFDFEGDPLWAEDGSTDWGLEYLFGVVEGPADDYVFKPFWAHDREGERQALLGFLDYVTARREAHPGMHIYHYAAYEKSALLRLAARHGVGEQTVDTLLSENVLVDLYPIVRACLRIGQRSYSIKKLEPLYMGEHGRDGDVTNAAASVVAYADYCELRDGGQADQARELLQGISDYNEYDCESTLRLRDWLAERAAEHGVELREPTGQIKIPLEELTESEIALREFAGHKAGSTRTPDQQAAALLAAAVGYHNRERKPYWWAHFDRLVTPIEDLVDIRDVMVVEQSEIEADWHKNTPRQKKFRRHIQLTGSFGTGTSLSPGSDLFALYATPSPDAVASENPTQRGTSSVKVTAVVKAEGLDVVTVEELLGGDEYLDTPVALAPGRPIPTGRMEKSIAAAAAAASEILPELPPVAAVDILRRSTPRTRSGSPLPPVGTDNNYAEAITAALLDLDDSYVAVQGPPGTGKTYTGARVVKTLIEQHQWRIGVVAQSHSVVENMLGGILKAGVDPALVAKKGSRSKTAEWQDIASEEYAGFIAEAEGVGCVIGGTAWDFSNTDRVPAGSLDLLVVDEAGQFALANTIAVAISARNLLLLGDPQQLPQVSKVLTPNRSTNRHSVGSPRDTAHCHPNSATSSRKRGGCTGSVCARVRIVVRGKLHSQETVSAARKLDGLAAGVHTVFVDHRGNSTYSPEESQEIVRQIQGLLGTPWTDPSEFEGTRPLEQSDILVVAAYNAQVGTVERDLTEAGLTEVEVGTVDKFQGREAAVAIVSMAASAVEDVPRGMSFLLSRNRLNVAVSRGKWCAIIVRSHALTQYMPSTPAGLVELGAFMRLTS